MTLKLLTPKEVTEKDFKALLPFDDEGIALYLNDPFTQISGIIREDNDEVVAVGILRMINEWKLIVNPLASHFEVSKAIKELSKQGMTYCLAHGSNEIYARITKGGDHYTKLLKKHFGFKEANGILLKLET